MFVGARGWLVRFEMTRPPDEDRPPLMDVGGVEAYLSVEQRELVESVLALVVSEARRMAPKAKRDRLSELISRGRLGAMRAALRFDPTRGAAFSTYAVPWIRGEIYAAFRPELWAKTIDRARWAVAREFATDLPDRVKVSRISEEACSKKLNKLAENLAGVMVIAEARAALPPDEALAERRTLEVVREGCQDAFANMTARVRQVIELRFWEDLGTSEVAKRLGIDETTVRRRTERGLGEIKKALVARGITKAITLHDREWLFAAGTYKNDGGGEGR